MQWEILDTGKGSVDLNMALDHDLLSQLRHINQPVLHLYDWEAPTITYGYFTNPKDYLNLEAVEKYKIQLGRRPTGGGVTFHLTDLAFSILIPSSHPEFSLNTLHNYAFVNRFVAEAIRRFSNLKSPPELLASEACSQNFACHNYCMAQPIQHDVMLAGLKVGGGAQRRTKYGYLHQGTIALIPPDGKCLKDLLQHQPIAYQAIQQHGGSLLPEADSLSDLLSSREKMQHILAELAKIRFV